MRYIFPILLLSLLHMISCEEIAMSDYQSKQFIKLFGNSGNDVGNAIATTNDNGYVIVGTKTQGNNTDMLVVKTDKFGNEEWQKAFGDSLNNSGNDIAISDNGNIVIVGTSFVSPGKSMIHAIELSPTGTMVWDKKIGNSNNCEGSAISIAPDGTIFILGNTFTGISSNLDSTDIIITKLSPKGDSLWSKTYGGNLHDSGSDLIMKDDNSYIVLGNTKNFAQINQDNTNILLFEIDKTGSRKGMVTYGGLTDDFGKSIARDPTGGFLIVGAKTNTNDRSSDVCLLKISDNIFEFEWSKTYGGKNDDTGEDIVVNEKNIFIAGTMEDDNTANENAYLLLLDKDGTEVNSKLYGSDGIEIFKSLVLAHDGGVILTGSSNFEDNSMITVVKTLPEEDLY